MLMIPRQWILNSHLQTLDQYIQLPVRCFHMAIYKYFKTTHLIISSHKTAYPLLFPVLLKIIQLFKGETGTSLLTRHSPLCSISKDNWILFVPPSKRLPSLICQLLSVLLFS